MKRPMKKIEVILAAALLSIIFLASFLIEQPQTVKAQSTDSDNHSSDLKIFSPSNTYLQLKFIITKRYNTSLV